MLSHTSVVTSWAWALNWVPLLLEWWYQQPILLSTLLNRYPFLNLFRIPVFYVHAHQGSETRFNLELVVSLTVIRGWVSEWLTHTSLGLEWGWYLIQVCFSDSSINPLRLASCTSIFFFSEDIDFSFGEALVWCWFGVFIGERFWILFCRVIFHGPHLWTESTSKTLVNGLGSANNYLTFVCTSPYETQFLR